jgi:predicted DCC family thiol-disulfide oxidoreductase YuxK
MKAVEPGFVKVYYDGLCVLCSAEINHYRKRMKDQSVEWVDISSASFDPLSHGVDPVDVHVNMHVKVGDKLHIGVDAFIAMWPHIPGYAWAGRLGKTPIFRFMMQQGYAVFSRLRPYLPRRKSADCDNGACEIPQRSTAKPALNRIA